MKKNHLKLVMNNKQDSPKRKLTTQENIISTGLIIVGIAMLIVLPIKPVDASEVFGVSFKKIKWAELCPNIQPVKVGDCEVVHPTSGIARNFKSGFEDLRVKTKPLNCENQKKIFEKRVGINPKICAAMFKATFSDLVLSGNKGVFSAEEFRDTYLSEGIVDLNALPKTKEAE